jgi:hypothetical protein
MNVPTRKSVQGWRCGPDLTPGLFQLRLVQQWLLISPLAGSLTAKGMRVRYRFVRLMADRAPRPLALDVKAL